MDGGPGIVLLLLAIFAALLLAAVAASYGARFIPIPTRWSGPAATAFFVAFLVLGGLDEFELLPFDSFPPILSCAVVGVLFLLSYNARRGEAKSRKVAARMGLTAASAFPYRTFEGTRGPFFVRLVLRVPGEDEDPFETLEVSIPCPALGHASFLVLRVWNQLPLKALGRLLLPAPGPAAWAGEWKVLSRPRSAAARLLRSCPIPRDDGRFRFEEAAANAGRLALRWRADRFEADDVEVLCARADEWLIALGRPA